MRSDPVKTRPHLCRHYLSSQAVASQVFSAQVSLTAVFGMGTGGPSPQSAPTYYFNCSCSQNLCCVPPECSHSRGSGTPSGTRTLDTLIKSQVLYQLS